MKRNRRFATRLLLTGCLALVLGLVMSPAHDVLAHANLVRSDPEAGAVLAMSPSTVTLEFSEVLDPAFSKVRLADSSLAVLVEGPGTVDPSDYRVLKLDLPTLPTGAYNVIWQARSVVDGHITNGVVAFSVGQSASGLTLLPPPGAPDPTTARPPLADTLLRWFSYAAAALTAGSLLFGVLVWRPAYRAWEAPNPSSDDFAARRLRRLARIGIVGLAVLSLGLQMFQAWEAARGAFQVPYLQALAKVLEPGSGRGFWLRLALLGATAFLVGRLSLPRQGSAVSWWAAAIAALLVLLTFSLQSHAVSLDSPLAVTVDWIHISAMAAWLGGLLPMFLLLREAGLPAHLLVPKFSRLALACVATLALSGLFSAFNQVRTLQALVSTTYGVALAIKSVLFAFLVGLGALNLLILSPRLKGSLEKATRWMHNSVRTELVIGSLVLAMVGLMTGASPAFEAVQARQRMGYIGDYKDGHTRMELWVAPARVGVNEIAVDVHGMPAGLTDFQPQVLLRLQAMEANLGITQVEAAPAGDSRYEVKGSFLNVAGTWQVDVILRSPRIEDIRHVFTVQVQPSPFAADLTNPIPATEGSRGSGKALYELDCLTCHGPHGKGDGPAGGLLHPPPADLTVHTAPGVHPDGQLFEWITNGYPGSAMPAFAEKLSDVQRWDLVNYIRTFGRK